MSSRGRKRLRPPELTRDRHPDRYPSVRAVLADLDSLGGTPFLTDVQDFRRWTPEGPDFTPARTITGSPTRLIVGPAPTPLPSPRSGLLSPFRGLPAAISFEAPRRTLVCVRRKTRRQVLHAMRRLGRGGGRRSLYSSISCR